MIRIYRKLNRQRGDTLLDIVFSMVIVGIIIAVGYASALFSWRVAKTAQQRTQAYYLAQYQTEALIAYRNAPGRAWDQFRETIQTIPTKTFYMKKTPDNCTTNCTWSFQALNNTSEGPKNGNYVNWGSTLPEGPDRSALDIYYIRLEQNDNNSCLAGTALGNSNCNNSARSSNDIMRFRVEVTYKNANGVVDTVSNATYLSSASIGARQ